MLVGNSIQEYETLVVYMKQQDIQWAVSKPFFSSLQQTSKIYHDNPQHCEGFLDKKINVNDDNYVYEYAPITYGALLENPKVHSTFTRNRFITQSFALSNTLFLVSQRMPMNRKPLVELLEFTTDKGKQSNDKSEIFSETCIIPWVLYFAEMPQPSYSDIISSRLIFRLKSVTKNIQWEDLAYIAVSYTHLTLPTNREV